MVPDHTQAGILILIVLISAEASWYPNKTKIEAATTTSNVNHILFI
jgi:hypothetical protein